MDINSLDNIKITITATNGKGIQSSEVITDVVVNNDDTLHLPFRVPNDLRHIQITMDGTIKRLIDGSIEALSASAQRSINSQKSSHIIATPHLMRSRAVGAFPSRTRWRTTQKHKTHIT